MIFCAILSLTAGIGLRFYNALHSTSSDILKEVQKNIDSESAQYRILKEQGRFNILVLGEDNVDSSRRSDTILFVTIDIDDKNVRILSLPRDTRVEVSGYGYQKLNHAFAFGGPDLIKATVEKYIENVGKAEGTAITVKKFIRFETGEGIAKKEENFAEEVAKQMGM